MTKVQRVPLKTVALPNEHGAWALLLEPSLLGLLVAPSGIGLVLVIAGTAAMMAQHPLSLALADARRGRSYPRTRLARIFALTYGAVAFLAVFGAVAWGGRADFLLPALLAMPLALVQLSFDARNRGRRLLPELAGASAVGAMAAILAMAGGWPLVPALGLWLVVSMRSIPSVLYVRTRLALEYGRQVDRRPALAAGVLAVAVVTALVVQGIAPVLALGAVVVLLARATLGLSRFRSPSEPKIVGMRELAFGLFFVSATAAGYVWGV